MNPLFKYHAKQIANSLGLSFRAQLPRRSTMAQFLKHLKRLGYYPRSVIDVGVADGTMELHLAFPDAQFLLVEPLEEFTPALQWLRKRYRAHVALCAAGSRDGRATIAHGTSIGDMHGATLAAMNDPRERALNKMRDVPMRRLDSLAAEFDLSSPILLKIDAQGAELDIVEGAERILHLTDVVIVEATFFSFNRDQPLFDNTLTSMLARDFFPYDMFGGLNRPLDGALGQIDIAFVHRNSRFRRDQRYADLNRRASWIEDLGMAARRMFGA